MSRDFVKNDRLAAVPAIDYGKYLENSGKSDIIDINLKKMQDF